MSAFIALPTHCPSPSTYCHHRQRCAACTSCHGATAKDAALPLGCHNAAKLPPPPRCHRHHRPPPSDSRCRRRAARRRRAAAATSTGGSTAVGATAAAMSASIALPTHCLLPSMHCRRRHRCAARTYIAVPPPKTLRYHQATAMLSSWPPPPRCHRHRHRRPPPSVGVYMQAMIIRSVS